MSDHRKDVMGHWYIHASHFLLADSNLHLCLTLWLPEWNLGWCIIIIFQILILWTEPKIVTLHWKAVDQYFTAVQFLFFFQFYWVSKFEKFVNFGFGTIRSGWVKGNAFNFFLMRIMSLTTPTPAPSAPSQLGTWHEVQNKACYLSGCSKVNRQLPNMLQIKLKQLVRTDVKTHSSTSYIYT